MPEAFTRRAARLELEEGSLPRPPQALAQHGDRAQPAEARDSHGAALPARGPVLFKAGFKAAFQLLRAAARAALDHFNKFYTQVRAPHKQNGKQRFSCQLYEADTHMSDFW